MPTIKRWCHVNQDINRDPEFRELAKKFGLGGVRFWLEALAILDRTDNFWDLHRGFDLGLLAASCQTKTGIIRGSYEHLVNINWLRVGVDPGMKMFIYAPNWAKYNKKREDKGSMMDTLRGDEKLHPIPSPSPPPIPKEEEKSSAILDKPKRQAFSLNGLQESFDQFWQAYPKKVGKGAVEKIWGRLKPNDELVQTMIEKLEIQKCSASWEKNGGEFIPNPATWLNEKRWTDEPVEVPSKKLRVAL